MVSALVLIADGSEEIEFSTIYDVLVRAEVDVKVYGINLKHSYATGSRGLQFLPNISTLPAAAEFDAILLPGGMPGATTFRDSPEARKLVQDFYAAGRLVGAICAATIAVAAAGDESGWKARVTSHPSVKEEVVGRGWDYADGEGDRVVVDGRVVTSRGPGTAMGFALEVAEILVGKEKVEAVKKPMLLAKEL